MIPLSVPNLGPAAREKVLQAMDAGWVSTAGPEVAAFEAAVAAYCEVPFAVATNSGTSALHLALRLAGVGAGDLVLAPNLTFIASLNPVYYLGAEAVLVDVVRETWQMDLDLVEEFLADETELRKDERVHKVSGKRVAALLGVHVLGYPCDVERLVALGQQYGVEVVEDAAEAMGSYWRDQHLGTFAGLAALSFNGNKIMTTGGGGMVLTSDPALAEWARNLSQQARRHPNEYLHDEIGYNYRMPNLAAAVGLGQLEQMEDFLQRKQEVFAFYKDAFAGLEVEFVEYAEGAEPNHWLATILTPRARLLEEVLHVEGVQSRKLWIPMDRLPPFGDCIYLSRENHSFDVYEASLSLPCSTGITDEELETVAGAVKRFLGG